MDNKLRDKISDEWESGNISAAYELAKIFFNRGLKSKKVNIIYIDALIGLNNFLDAKAFLDQQVDTSNSNYLFHLYMCYGYLYTKKSDILKSISYYKQAHLVMFSNPAPLIYIAKNYYMLGNFDDSKKYLNQVLELGEELNDEAYFNLALIEKSLRNYDNALIFLQKALVIDPQYYKAIDLMNDCKIARNRKNSPL